MVKLNAGNVLLKPSHRRQLMNRLRRSMRMGTRLGNFAMTIQMERVGKQFEVRADVQDSAGNFQCRSRRTDFDNAVRDLTGAVANRLHDQCLQQVSAA